VITDHLNALLNRLVVTKLAAISAVLF